MDQPKIPTLKDAQKPQVKVKGLGSGLTLFDRLKQFKKKDLAFILAGLGTLFMAPLAEHFMMAPENGSGDLQSGFRGGSGSGNGIFGSGSSPYESGNNSIAQGGAIGGAGDIITPLNVRDPSALVMGPGAQQQPPAGAATPQVAAPTTTSSASSEDYKDALKASASRAASAAVKKSPLPIPKIAVGGSGLRGLGVAGGGSSATGGLGPIGGGSLGQAGTGGGGLNLVKSAPGYRGAAGARGPGNPTGLDGTKKAGANAGDAFSRTGSALSGLNAAAAEQIPTGGQGFGGGGQGGAGANDKGAGGNGPGGSKSVGESLAFIEAKERMMENLKLEFEKRKLKDPELLLYGIRNDSLKAMASEMTKSLTKGILGFMDGSKGGGSVSGFWCKDGEFYPDSSTSFCLADGKYLGQPTGSGGGCMAKTPTVTCSPGSKAGDAKSTPANTAEGGVRNGNSGRITVPQGATPDNAINLCEKIATKDMPYLESQVNDPKVTAQTKKDFEARVDQMKGVQVTLANMAALQFATSGSGSLPSNKCGTPNVKLTKTAPDLSVKANIEDMRKVIAGDDGKGGLVKSYKDALAKSDAAGVAKLKADTDKVVAQWTATDTLLKDVRTGLDANKGLIMSRFDAAQVRPDQDKFEQSWKDTDGVVTVSRKTLDNLKPVVDGLNASGSKLDAPADAGSAKYVADTATKVDTAFSDAKKATVKSEDGKTDVPLLKDSEIPTRPEGKSVAAAPPAAGTPPSPTVFVDGSKAVVTEAKKAADILATLKFDGTDVEKKASKEKLINTAEGSMSASVANAMKTQGDVLDGMGSASNAAIPAADAPK